MAKPKVHVDDAPLHSGHAIRGMGFYTRNLMSALQKNKEIELVDKEYNIIHHPYFDLFSNTLKPKTGEKVVVTIPDVIPLLYPNIYKPGIKGRLNFFRQKSALQKVNAVITISETSKKDIVRLLNVPAEKIFVTLLGPGNPSKKTTKKLDLPKDYVLYVGDINWTKNTIKLIKAVSKAKTNLVIVGKQAKELKDRPDQFDFSHPEIAHFKELNKLLNEKNVYVLGYLKDEEFAAVYQQATLYCQPSYYEGFGLPLLEAMQAEIPIVAAQIQALVEVADDAAYYIDPYDEDDMSAGIEKVMLDNELRKELVNKGVKRVKQFSWEKTAHDTIEVYKTLL